MDARIRCVATVAVAALSAVCVGRARAAAVTPGAGAVTLNGTTLAAQPQLQGTVLQDVITPWSSAIDPQYGFPGATGTLQSRVVQETGTGTLDFYWRVTVDVASYPSYVPTELDLSGLSLSSFETGSAFDADYRIDGLGNSAPPAAVAPSATQLDFQLDPSSFGPGSSTYFLLLRSNATAYDDAALASLGPTSVATFEPIPAVAEPGTVTLLFAGLVAMGALARRSAQQR